MWITQYENMRICHSPLSVMCPQQHTIHHPLTEDKTCQFTSSSCFSPMSKQKDVGWLVCLLIYDLTHIHTHTHSGALLSVLYIISIAQRFQYGLHLSSRWWWWDQTEKVMLSKKKKRHSSFWELYYSFKVITKYNWRWSTNWDVNKTKNKPEREQHQSLCVQLRHVG